MADVNVSNRITLKDARMRIGLITVALSKFTPVGLAGAAAGLPLYGPLREVEIDAPVLPVTATGGGDVGVYMAHSRWGEWSVRAGAFLDIASVDINAPLTWNGDARMGALIGQYAEFYIYSMSGIALCGGYGRVNGRLTGNAANEDPVVRDLTIARWLGSSDGNLIWYNLATGLLPAT